MTIEAKLDRIRERATLYAILFRNGGVALQFYEAPAAKLTKDWADKLVVHRFYPTLAEAVDAEMERLGIK